MLEFLLKLLESILKGREPAKVIPFPVKSLPGFTLHQYLTSSGKYPERENHVEATEEVKKNAAVLLDLVNQLLRELGLDPSTMTISSGFRTSEANGSIPNAAKKSLHMSGLAIDISDPDDSLDKLITSKPEILDKYGLWLENSNSTPKWTHLDKGVRSQRKIRIFHP